MVAATTTGAGLRRCDRLIFGMDVQHRHILPRGFNDILTGWRVPGGLKNLPHSRPAGIGWTVIEQRMVVFPALVQAPLDEALGIQIAVIDSELQMEIAESHETGGQIRMRLNHPVFDTLVFDTVPRLTQRGFL